MRITFLLFNADGVGGTSRSVITQANALAAGEAGQHEVSILSLTRSADRPHHPLDPRVGVEYLVDLTDDRAPTTATPGLVPPETATALATAQSRYMPRRWDKHFNRLVDVAAEHRLPTLETDVVVTTTPEVLGVAVQLLDRRVAVVHQEHRSTPARGADLEPLLIFAPRADVVATLTESDRRWLAEQLGPLRPELVSMPNPLPREFAPRSRLDRPLVVAAGRLVPEKRFHHLVHAFGQVADAIPDWRLRIYGSGPQRNQLASLARRHHLYDRVELPGSTDAMAGEWAKASICALSSRSEGFPLVVQEAMAAGVPVVSYDSPSGPREIVEHGRNGLLVEPGSREGLADALLRLASDADLRRAMGEAAYQSSLAYDAGAVARRWVEVFEQALRIRGAGTPVGPAEVGRDPDLPPAGVAGAEGDGLTPAVARAAALAAAVAAARAGCGDDWFVIPPHRDEPPVLVVPSERRRAYLEALAAADVPPFLSLHRPQQEEWHARRGPVAEMVEDLLRGMVPVARLEPWPLTESGTSLLAGASVEVQLWQTTLDGHWLAPTHNRYGDRVPPDAPRVDHVVDGVPVRTLPEMTLPVVDECPFPVDVVYTWVDGSDPAWNQRREARLAELTGVPLRRESSGRARFESRDELRYSMRSLHLFAPWVRTIHLVTAGQVPAWLDTDHDRVRVVDHAEILPSDALPTFNSHAIESRLQHVPDLAEHFVYVNDDVMLTRPTRPEHFFTPAGAFTAFLAEVPVGLAGQQDRPYLVAAANNRRLLAEAFGVHTTHTMGHTPHPHRRSVLAEIEERFADAVAATTRSPFRSEGDVSLLSSFAQHYGLLTGTAVATSADVAYVDLGVAGLSRQLTALTSRRHDFVCIADPHDFALPTAQVDEMLRAALERAFPVPAPWERG